MGRHSTTTPAPEDVAVRVQAAADRLQRLALAATPGTWTAEPAPYPDSPPSDWEIHAQQGPGGVREDVVSHQLHEGGGIDHQPDAAYITALQPAVGTALATVLQAIAGRMRAVQEAGLPVAQYADPAVLALVDAVLTHAREPSCAS